MDLGKRIRLGIEDFLQEVVNRDFFPLNLGVACLRRSPRKDKKTALCLV